MADFFRQQGLSAVAVHSGQTSAPRAKSLEELSSGLLDVICAVDVFNEGLDLPELDTVLMLRPTESRILWLQQFGRGLRKTAGDKQLTVIDYIGNHRTFLLKPQTLFSLQGGGQELLNLLERAQKGPIEILGVHLKTGHLSTVQNRPFRRAETGEGLPCGLFLAQVGVDLGTPAARSTSEDVRVMEESIEESSDRGGVSEELAPVIDWTV
jgi:hypothetical protein